MFNLKSLGRFAAVSTIILTAACIAQTPVGRTRLDANRSLGTPKTYKNLTLIPVYDSSAKPGNSYITLDEGLKAGVIKVTESKQGGEVNTLYVTNSGRKPVHILAGEVVLGGQQDRSVGRDTIIEPQKKDIPIAVFCVEHGRWTGRKEFQESAKTVASADVRGAAQDGAFKVAAAEAMPAGRGGQALAGLADVDSRPALNGEGRVQTLGRRAGRGEPAQSSRQAAYGGNAMGMAQQKVWDSVAKKNEKFKAQSQTGTYRGVLNLSAGEAQKSVGPYIGALNGAADGDSKLIGMVAAVNGKVVAADVFHDPVLFKKLWPKLLRSYAADAAENSGDKVAGAKPVAPSEAKAFLIEASDGKSKAQAKTEAGTSWRVESTSSLSYRLVPNAPGAPAVHENVLKK